ncbi:prepilin-type N-terminal cleavage/methylation domain-containing protein [Candidatus Pelagibacter sp.]|nr:prepilin-type N-terminal cleavage/methylation domain-containing protein [Candidatus Pelagibacter sp.]
MKKKNQKGFTLIELLVVVAIIGILAAVGVTAYSGYTEGAKKSTTKTIHANLLKYIAAEWQKCSIDPNSQVMVKTKGTAAQQIECSTEGASEIQAQLISAANSPVEDKDPYNGGYAIVGSAPAGKAVAGNVVLTVSGNVLTLSTCFELNDAGTACSSTGTLTNTVTIEG